MYRRINLKQLEEMIKKRKEEKDETKEPTTDFK